jgi:hypothetical protein
MHHDSVGMYMHESHGQSVSFHHRMIFCAFVCVCVRACGTCAICDNPKRPSPSVFALVHSKLGLQCHWPLFLGPRVCSGVYRPSHLGLQYSRSNPIEPKNWANIYNIKRLFLVV